MGSNSWENTSFKNFTFRRLSIDDHARVMEVLRHSFVVDEPINRIFGFTEERFAYLDLRVKIFLALNLSIGAFDIENQNLAALLLNIPNKKGHDLGIPPPKSDNGVRQFLSRIENEHDLYEKYGVTQYGDIFIASVHRDYRGQGLATEIYRRSFELFRENGDTVVKCLVTSPFTRKIVAKLGFVEIGSWKFSEAKDDDGNKLIGNISEEEDGTVAMTVLKL